jgi:methylase of polypeptide subunit release factors
MRLSEINLEDRTWPEAFRYVSRFSFFEAPSHFARVISTTVPIRPGRTKLLDIGCGSGIVGLYCLAERGAAFVTFSDIQSIAIAESIANAIRTMENNRTNVIRPDQLDFLEACPFGSIPSQIVSSHDMLVFNPPQLPTDYLAHDELLRLSKDRFRAAFRLGGADGLRVLREFLLWYSYLEEPTPPATVLLSSFLGLERIRSTFRTYNLAHEIKAETIVPLRRILNGAAELFSDSERAERGLRKAENGEWEKTLLTITFSRTPENV